MAYRATTEKASLISQTSISLGLRPAYSRAFLEAGTGPAPMRSGGTPATPKLTKLAMGLRPSFLALSLDMISIPVAPAFRGEELPAVIVPSAL